MRLLRCDPNNISFDRLVFAEFEGSNIPRYAILSHTWSEDEVLFRHVEAGTARARAGYTKVKSAMEVACSIYRMEYIWIDTCCIDKSSSAELSEAINSMYSWYANSFVCLAYLADLKHPLNTENLREKLTACRWFTRGWCLQELVAPEHVIFFSSNWVTVGTKREWNQLISDITHIDPAVLAMKRIVSSLSIAQRMSWAAKRQTTRPEDMAYCLLGIFDVNMPLLYGEGQKAFQRLQEEIIKTSHDESIFAWVEPSMGPREEHGLLADSPSSFANSGHIYSLPVLHSRESWQMTNRGLQVQLPLIRVTDPRRKPGMFYLDEVHAAVLNCPISPDGASFVSIALLQVPGDNNWQFRRVVCNRLFVGRRFDHIHTVYVSQRPASMFAGAVFSEHCFRLSPRTFSAEIEVLEVTDASDEFSRYGEKFELRKDDFSFKIARQARELSLVITCRRRANGLTFAVLLGSLSDSSVGFDVREGPDSLTDELRDMRAVFKPLRMGACKRLSYNCLLTVNSFSYTGDYGMIIHEVVVNMADQGPSGFISLDNDESAGDDYAYVPMDL